MHALDPGPRTGLVEGPRPEVQQSLPKRGLDDLRLLGRADGRRGRRAVARVEDAGQPRGEVHSERVTAGCDRRGPSRPDELCVPPGPPLSGPSLTLAYHGVRASAARSHWRRRVPHEQKGENTVTTENHGPEKVTFALTGPADGPPTLDDLLRLFERLTGRAPAPEDVERARKVLEQGETRPSEST